MNLKQKLRDIIREEVQNLSEDVGTMDGRISFVEQGSGSYVLTIKDSSGSKTSTKMTQKQADALHELIMDKV
jgi:hypothetical protein